MAFDVYGLIRSEEMQTYLRKNRAFTPLEQEFIIRNSYYPLEQKIEWLKELLEETAECREKEILEERMRLVEEVLKYIYDPGEGALYMSVENSTGYDGVGNEYELSQCVIRDTHYFKNYNDLKQYWDFDGRLDDIVRVDIVDMNKSKSDGELVQPVWFSFVYMESGLELLNFGITEEWFIEQGYSEECMPDCYSGMFRSPFPFMNGSRLKLRTPAMENPVYGVIDSSMDSGGFWYHFLLIEDAEHDAEQLKNIIDEGKVYSDDVQYMDLSYALLEPCGDYLTYDWIESV